MRDFSNDGTDTLQGRLLVAHPGLLDPNFRKAVVLIAEHSVEEGAIGVILNRPLDQTLEEVKPEWAGTLLGDVPVYEGGPVRRDDVLLVAWRSEAMEEGLRLYFGAPPEHILEMIHADGLEVRAYIGHSGWGSGQIEGELAETAWLVSPVLLRYLNAEQNARMWRGVLAQLSPELALLADAPEDPSVN